MDKFYRIEKTVTYSSGTACAFFERDDYDVALAEVLSSVAYAINSDDAYSCLGMIIDKEGNVLRREYWHDPVKPDPEADPEPTPEPTQE